MVYIEKSTKKLTITTDDFSKLLNYSNDRRICCNEKFRDFKVTTNNICRFCGGEVEDYTCTDSDNLAILNTVFIDCEFLNCEFHKIFFSNVNFINCQISNTKFIYTKMSNCKLISTSLHDCEFLNSRFLFDNFIKSEIVKCNFGHCLLSNIQFSNVDLNNCNFGDVDFNLIYFLGCCLDSISIAYMEAYWVCEKIIKFLDCHIEHCTGLPYIPMTCPEKGSFIGYKKAIESENNFMVIVKLQIPAKAKRSSGTRRKCRCSEAKVLSITSPDGKEKYDTAVSDFDNNFKYKVGDIIKVDDYDENRFNDCSRGIHFFMNREEAVEYNFS